MTDAMLARSFAGGLGLAILHFLWQGILIGALTALAFMALRRASANARYVAGCLGLAAMLAAPIATTAIALQQPPRVAIDVVALAEAAADVIPPVTSTVAEPDRTGLERWLPIVPLVWSAGVVVLAARLLGGWRHARRIRRQASPLAADPWPAVVHSLAARLRVTRPVVLLKSGLTSVPAVIGWVRPAIVVPVSALAHLSPSDLEAILAHELAHIRRGDYLVNIFQCVVETLLFYHPAVWWVSRQIRLEREHCCDDLAVSVSGDRLGYAKALSSLEELQPRSPAFAVAATGGELLTRIRRVLQPEPTANPTFSGGVTIMIALTLVLCAVGILTPQAQSAQSDLGRLVGTVRDQQGGVVPGATVTVGAPGSPVKTSVTNASGYFVVGDLTPGPYEAWISLSGFRTAGIKAQVAAGQDAAVSVQLQVGTLTEIVTVSAPRPLVTARPTSPAATRDSRPQAPLRVGGDIRAPKKIRHVAPIYPDDAVAAGIEGIVIIETTIDRDGLVSYARVLRSVPMLDEAALTAVRQWAFTPTLLNNLAVPISSTVTVSFTLR